VSDPFKTVRRGPARLPVIEPTDGRQEDGVVKILFVAGFAPVVRDMAASKRLYGEALGLPLEGDYPATDRLDGAKHFGLWSLSEAARACFGTDRWPADVPVPQASLEFDVDDVDAAATELERAGYRLIHRAKREPWGQTICRLLSPEGLLLGLGDTPWLRAASRTVSLPIACPALRVYAFVSNGENLAQWLTFCRSVRRSGAEWLLDTPGGEMGLRFVPQNELGVLDHWARLPGGEEVLNPMRVVPNGAGSEVIFTLFRRPGMSDEEFARDARTVETDLRKLREVLEA
jgi:catechol 2,3-dioxygenase-like lactoylglutathione lyase family enzyme